MNKTNTVRRGDLFEDRCFELIKAAIDNMEFCVLPECCTIERKKKYYSKAIDDHIEFDMSIEVSMKGVPEYSFLYLIECKDYDSKIPGSDVTEFINNVKLVAGLNVKPIVITTSKMQPRALKLAQHEKIMWILVDGEESTTMLYNSRKKKNIYQDSDLPQLKMELAQLQEITSLMFSGDPGQVNWDNLIEKFLRHSLAGNLTISTESESGSFGLERLSSKLIENMTDRILDDFDPNIRKHCLALNPETFINYLKTRHDVSVDHTNIPQEGERDNRGAYIAATKTILIDHSVVGTDQYLYVLAHEAGHFFLHGNVKINQAAYDKLPDSRYNKKSGRYELLNERNWLEWQASKFGTSLLIPELSVMARLIQHQYKADIRNKGKMFVDNDPKNFEIFTVTIDTLRNFFGVSETVMEYRLGNIGILRYGKNFRRPIPTYEALTSRAKTVGQLLGRAFEEMEQKILGR